MKKYLLPLLLTGILNICCAQTNLVPKKVIMQGFTMGPYWDGTAWDTAHTWGVPCPNDKQSLPQTDVWFYDRLSQKANEIAASGITAVWLPSFPKGSGGYYGFALKPKYAPGGIYDVGYGIFDDYDLGDKVQNGTLETRYGSRNQLTRCIATLRANGLEAYHDFVVNQRNGLNIKPVAPHYQVLGYKDAYGNDNGGRFPKYAGDFAQYGTIPGAPGDTDLPSLLYPDGTPTGDKETRWGPDFAHITGQKNINGTTGVWCAEQIKIAGDWLVRATGVQGYRLDNASGISWNFLRDFVNYGAMKGKFSMAELVGTWYSNYQLQEWLEKSIGEKGNNFTMMDQMLQPLLIAICKTDKYKIGALQSKYLSWNSKDSSRLVNAINPQQKPENPGKFSGYRSVMAIDPEQAVTVLNEADMETPIGTMPRVALPKECLLGYAYILTIGYGTPLIASKDWNTDAGSYGATMIGKKTLNQHLNKLIWCHNFITTGGLTNEQVAGNGYVYAFQKTGGSQAMVFLNSDQQNDISVTVNTTIPNGTVLTDYTDHDANATVTNGQITVKVPANINGRGYLVLARPGITGTYKIPSADITQEWEGNKDLGIKPASGTRQEVCRIWVDGNKKLTSKMLDYYTAGWSRGSNLVLEVCKLLPGNTLSKPVASRTFTSAQPGQELTYTTKGTPACYVINIKGNNLPAGESNWWFKLQNTYTAPPKFN
ncbi:hypothetical protein DJ568_15185 [Mucilaginibacter hurinus]|uniref:Glycosyl hydrolase family 13 catalytic domain-containing protein n=1 Tax=Mucilaginibacter hurinus TaxID=2201324 RepID=A0A367GK94_9SPHI|nr:hypothetical protein [Mucilaginibacter hurinus]RCH53882.1 hypothetical protein DJ568_15185 [Mucilaginibacter hurinus]